MRPWLKLPAVGTAVLGFRGAVAPARVKEIGMPIDPAGLARHLSSLASLDAEDDLQGAMQQLASAAKALLRVDGVGLMLADARGELRWAAASDQQTQIIEEGQERLGEGPCVNAFAERAPMAMRDAAKEPQWGKITDVVTGQEMRAGLSVPVQLEGGPIGSLDLYSRCAQGLGSGGDQRGSGVCGVGGDAALSGRGRPGQGAAGRAVAGGVGAPQPDRAGQGDGDAAGGD